MDVGFDLIFGVGFKFLGVMFVDEWWKFKGVCLNFDDDCFVSEVVELELVCGVLDECVVDSDCFFDEVILCMVYICKFDCICCVYELIINCCVMDVDCDDGDLMICDFCIGGLGSCCFELIIGYCERDVDCDDGDFNIIDICMFLWC